MVLKSLKKLVSVLTLGAMLVSTTAAQAGGLNSMLQGMYTASANPAYAQTENMNVYSAGYLAVRTPLQQFNVIAFTPPNINAGCGGVDAYFGAFSFINSSQMEALIKAIGQDAVPYLFKIALGSMCKQCLSTLDQLADQLQRMSSTINNACEIDEGIFSGDNPDLTSKHVGEQFKTLGVDLGQVGDAFGSFFGNGQPGDTPNSNQQMDAYVQGAPLNQSGATASTATAASATQLGNSSWKGIIHNNVEQAFTGETNNGVTAEILMSLMGTCISNLPSGSGSTNNSGPAGNAVSNSAASSTAVNTCAAPTLELDNLVKGTQGAEVLQCEAYPLGASAPQYNAMTDASNNLYEDACRALAPPSQNYTLGALGYVGLENYVSCAMLGAPQDSSVNCATVNPNGVGIVGDIQAGIPFAQWTPLEQQVATATPVRFAQYMQAVSGNPSMQQTIASMALPYAIDFAAVNLGVAVRRAIVSTYSGTIPQSRPPNFGLMLQTLDQQIAMYSQRLAGSVQADNAIKAYVENYLASLNANLPGQ